MWLKLVYLYRNLTRNILRTALTCAAVALPIMIYVLSSAVIDGLNRYLDNSARQLRLVVVHKSSIVNPLPVGHRAKIESLDPTGLRITSVCGMRWLGGRVPNESVPLSTLAAEHDTLVATFPDLNLTEDEIDHWNRDRRAIIVGDATARQMREKGFHGWEKGGRISFAPSIPPYMPMEFNVVSTAPNATDKLTNFCRLDYYEEEAKKQAPSGSFGLTPDGWVSFLFVKCATKADLDHYRTAIDAMFAGSPDETKTQDEKSFMMDFINQLFNLPQNLAILSAVTIFVAVMAAANTMSMNIRDRLNEMATLKSMGFKASTVFGFIQTESLLLCALGGAIGAAVPYIAFTHTPLRNYQVPLIMNLEIFPSVCLQSLLIAAAIGLLAAAWPAWSAARLHVVSALRNLE